MKLIVFVAFVLFYASTAGAVTINCGAFSFPGNAATVCTKLFSFSGICTGGDDNPTFDGINSPFITPWEPISISILKVGVMIFPPTPTYWTALAGNSFEPDFMSMQSSEGVSFGLPEGFTMQFPAAPSLYHLDLHFSCPTNSIPHSYGGYYWVVYQPNMIP